MSTSAVQNLTPPGRTRKLTQNPSTPSEGAEAFEHALADARDRDAAKPRETRKPDAQQKDVARKSKSAKTQTEREDAAPADDIEQTAVDHPIEAAEPEAPSPEKPDAREAESLASDGELCAPEVQENAASPTDPLALLGVSTPRVHATASAVITEGEIDGETEDNDAASAIQKVQTQGGTTYETLTPQDASRSAPQDGLLESSLKNPQNENTPQPEAVESSIKQVGKPLMREIDAGAESKQDSSSRPIAGSSTPLPTTVAAGGTSTDMAAPVSPSPSEFTDMTAATTTSSEGSTPQVNLGSSPTTASSQSASPVKSAQPVTSAAPELHFAESNHDRIVTGVRTQLLPGGGSMQIRLDPPELGALQVMVEMRDGVMSATFQTSSDEATRLLSHSLNHLKGVLESQGVGVERLQVQQASRNESSNAGDDSKQQQQNWSEDHASRQEQERKELLKRMWRKISGNQDPLDLVA